MRVSKVAFHGYQRLVDTSCSTAGKMIAFLGPNEAGKTTVLRALDWYSNGEGELAVQRRSTARPRAPDEAVVRVTYWLDERDRQSLADLGLAEIPLYFERSRRTDGSYVSQLLPSRGLRATKLFDEARALFGAAIESEPALDPDESEPNLRHFEGEVTEVLRDVDGEWSDEWDESFQDAVEHLEAMGRPDVATVLERVREVLQRDHPDGIARERLRSRAPQFVLFDEEDRAIRSSYNLADEVLRQQPPSALANLSWVADLDLDGLWAAVESGDKRRVGTSERRANERLATRLSARWSQKNLRVEFNVNGSELEVQIFEDDANGAVTSIDERSDGLRTFVALVAFLARHDFESPPVLLVDEAETHLHYDAQADLVEVLAKDVQATQVFYTTHSPGCLPRDLGTGVRLVAPVQGRVDESRLRNDFWTSNSPGFTPLLFAMGAGAAAFSAFRKAVLTEGACDMILLPSLLREATRQDDLDFQVAPGIANYRGSGLELEEVAARVVYLVDGDRGGENLKKRLSEMRVPDERILQLDTSTAIEDYVHPDVYLGLVNGMLELAGTSKRISIDELARDIPIAKAVEDWCKGTGVATPGKTALAALLVDDLENLELADGAAEKLQALHDEILRALGS